MASPWGCSSLTEYQASALCLQRTGQTAEDQKQRHSAVGKHLNERDADVCLCNGGRGGNLIRMDELAPIVNVNGRNFPSVGFRDVLWVYVSPPCTIFVCPTHGAC